jgi:galactokinase
LVVSAYEAVGTTCLLSRTWFGDRGDIPGHVGWRRVVFEGTHRSLAPGARAGETEIVDASSPRDDAGVAIRRAVSNFRRRFGTPPQAVAFAPGRVNLIGEHTDYNDGFVLPMALSRGIALAWRPRADANRIELHSDSEQSACRIDLSTADVETQGAASATSWSTYVAGVLLALRRSGRPVAGIEGTLASTLPCGAGLSSSAALELACLRALWPAGHDWDALEAARLAHAAENDTVAVRCGIMDSFAVALSRAGHLLHIDCRNEEARDVGWPGGVVLAVLDTGTRRSLATSAYNDRRADCERAARTLGVAALRDMDPRSLERRRGELDERAARRARHVVTENERVLLAERALAAGDLASLGALLDASHRSLREDFEVSSPALDAMVDAARAHPACYGARLTGAGFAGCAVALVDRTGAQDFARRVPLDYEVVTGRRATVWLERPSGPARLVPRQAWAEG